MRSCFLYQNSSAKPDCSSYAAFFQAVDADCKRWEKFEAYLSVEIEGEYNSVGSGVHYYKLGCRDTRLAGNSGWEGGLLSIITTLSCPAWGTKLDVASRSCIGSDEDVDTSSNSCSPTDGLLVGNFILPPTAEKYQPETDHTDASPGGPSFSRTYRSNRGLDTTRPSGPLGKTWTHNHSLSLTVFTSSKSGTSTATLTTPEGTTRTFTQASAASPWLAVQNADTLVFTAGVPVPWTYRRADDDSTARFDSSGRLVSLTQRNGWTTTYGYNASGQLSLVAGPFGRTLALGYNAAGLLASLTTADGRVLSYGYDSMGRLVSVTYPDAKSRTYLYENPAFPHALTGIVDEAGARYGTYGYDTQGRAITTEHAGGVDRYQVSYPAVGTASVIDPLGTVRNYTYATQGGKLAVTGASLPSATGHSDASSRTQDAAGLLTGRRDFFGVTTANTWDTARRLPLSVTEAANTPQARTTTTRWHPVFSLPVLVTEAGRTTANSYDDKGNLLSQTVTDTSGATPARTWQWTYNAQGLVETATQPNGAVTRYT